MSLTTFGSSLLVAMVFFLSCALSVQGLWGDFRLRGTWDITFCFGFPEMNQLIGQNEFRIDCWLLVLFCLLVSHICHAFRIDFKHLGWCGYQFIARMVFHGLPGLFHATLVVAVGLAKQINIGEP